MSLEPPQYNVPLTTPQGRLTPQGYAFLRGAYDALVAAGAVDLSAGNITFSPSANNPATDVQDAIENVSDDAATALQPNDTGTWELIDRETISNQATVDFFYDGSLYDKIVHEFDLVKPVSATSLFLRTSPNGTTFDGLVDGYEYSHIETSASIALARSGTQFSGYVTRGNMSSSANTGLCGSMSLVGSSSTTAARFHITGSYINSSGDLTDLRGSVTRNTTPYTVQGVRFLAGSGNIESGTISVWGLRK